MDEKTQWKWNSIICKSVKLYQLGIAFIKKKNHHRFEVTNAPIYSIQREVIKEFESLK